MRRQRLWITWFGGHSRSRTRAAPSLLRQKANEHTYTKPYIAVRPIYHGLRTAPSRPAAAAVALAPEPAAVMEGRSEAVEFDEKASCSSTFLNASCDAHPRTAPYKALESSRGVRVCCFAWVDCNSESWLRSARRIAFRASKRSNVDRFKYDLRSP